MFSHSLGTSSHVVLRRSQSALCRAAAQRLQLRNAASDVASVCQNVRGTHDILPDTPTGNMFDFIEKRATSVSDRFGYRKIVTPILEHYEVFNRSLGADSDVVMKEMFTISNAGEFASSKQSEATVAETAENAPGTILCLRPEMTAAVVRSLVQNRLVYELPQKLYYIGPMFRRERPQKGRYRQFHQFGTEYIGSNHPHSDVEAIDMAFQFLKELGINADSDSSTVKLEINSIGSNRDRELYRDTLKAYLDKHMSSLSQKSQLKLQRGSLLRVLDSNEPEDQSIINSAPLLLEHMSEDSLKRFEAVLQGLEWLGHTRYEVNPHLVRGLDYYAHTAFEFKDHSLGAKTAVLAGGRYDALIHQMGGPIDTPAIGWACGIERISQLLHEKEVAKQLARSKPIFVVAARGKVFKHDDNIKSISTEKLSALLQGSASRASLIGEPAGAHADDITTLTKFCLQLCQRLRSTGKFNNVQFIEKANFKKQLEHANKADALCAIIVGSEEFARGSVYIKNFANRQQQPVTITEIEQKLEEIVSGISQG